MKTIIINGSLNEFGKCYERCALLDQPIYWLGNGIEKAIELILESDTIIFASPVYWFNISSYMKQLIEKLPESPNFPCEGKKAYFIATFEEDGGQQAINQMFAPLNHMGFEIPPYASYFF